MVVLFEGIDTCGKSTQLELLKQKHPEIITTKEPGGTAFGIKAREILLESTIISKRAELLLFLADRAEHFEEVIQPNQDKLVISDRGFISGIGYALANDDFEIDELVMLNNFALQGNLPDKVILFLTDMQTLQERLGGKSLDGIEQRGLEYLLSVQEHMKQTVLALDIPHLFIDARDTIENIHQTILTYLKV
ncbi:dTMP kinase [Sulfurovum sp.]|jgi:dTMP kinase|uniref:dTMP kinase n=1 Tax=Sulfurovum sp. TaxID=1969726 RepID=UPI002A36C567|nr:dTMP kinase [Sulfurovum sp.]MDD3499826.1 dTMP kinase [Sulfurovum sp.]MDY0403449.1 dTMP kinase [Sulfurovum sp.]